MILDGSATADEQGTAGKHGTCIVLRSLWRDTVGAKKEKPHEAVFTSLQCETICQSPLIIFLLYVLFSCAI